MTYYSYASMILVQDLLGASVGKIREPTFPTA